MGYIKVNENVKFDSSHDINDILSKIKLIPDKENILE